MDTERVRVSLKIWWLRLVTRLRTLSRAAAVVLVGIAGGNIVIPAILPPITRIYRPLLLNLVNTSSVLIADIAALTIGLVTILALSLFPRPTR